MCGVPPPAVPPPGRGGPRAARVAGCSPPSPPLHHCLPPHAPQRYDRRSGAFQATDLGRIASHYYVTHTTIAAFNEHLRPTMGEIELLRLFRWG